MLVIFDLLRDMVGFVGPEPWRRASHSVVDPTCLARLKWEMEWALRTFIEKPSWRQPHYRTQDENPNPNPNPNGRLKKNCGVILLFKKTFSDLDVYASKKLRILPRTQLQGGEINSSDCFQCQNLHMNQYVTTFL